MNIIIDPDQIESYRKKYTVLELDTIRILPEDRKVTAYCVVENISLGELFSLEHNKSIHTNLMENYKKKDWTLCQRAIEELIGAWSGELDSFYEDLSSRITKYIDEDPGETWDGVIEKHTDQ